MNKIRVVLDTNVLVSAFIKYGGNEWRILRKAILGEIILITSDEIIEEFESVISRPKFGYSKERVNEMKNFITSASRTVVPDERFNIVKDDPSDNKIIECGVAGNVNYIISGNKHLINLKEFRGIKIVKGKEFIDVWDSDRL